MVELSSIGARPGSPVPTWDWHGQVTGHLRASGVPPVILQANFFMSNLFMSAESIRAGAKIFAPANGARIAIIDPRDVAACAAALLSGPGHEGRTYVLGGPEAITYGDIAGRLVAVNVRRLRRGTPGPSAAGSAR